MSGPDDCWNWTASLGTTGYGQFHWNGRPAKSHRVAWELANGPIPDDLCVLHSCDNRRCVNVRHLWLGTKKDNTHDMLSKGRNGYGIRPKGISNRYKPNPACRRGHSFPEWRSERGHCILCHREREHARRRSWSEEKLAAERVRFDSIRVPS